MDRQPSIMTRTDLECMLIDQTEEPKALPLSLLEEITDGFSDEQQIGEGGFATVYKGVLANGAVAVKRLSNTHMHEKEFHREVECLMMVRHKNVVRFLGYCADTQGSMERFDGKLVMADVQKRLLCFEYLPNGSLDKYINDASRGLDWRNRYQIIKGIIQGLHYLHGKNIVHLDLKPANILLDHNMVPKIADFGLSRCFDEHQTRVMTTKIGGTFGYVAPEFGNLVITRMFDLYSLGVIIIELLTGEKGYHAVENVLESWRARLEKSPGDAQLDQIRVCAQIGIECTEFNPLKRPVTRQIIDRLDEMENMDESMKAGMTRSSPLQEDMLLIEPVELRFPFELNKKISCSIQLTNKTDAHIAFNIETPHHFWIQPNKGIVPPRLNCSVIVTLQPQEKVLQHMLHGHEFFLESTKVKEGLKAKDITEDMFSKEVGRVVDKVNLTAVFGPQDLDQLGTGNLNRLAKAEISSSTSNSNELIQVDPPNLEFLFLPNTSATCSVKLVNITDYHVSFNTWVKTSNMATYYTTTSIGILAPRSTKQLKVTRVANDKEVQDMECKDKFFLWKSIVAEDFKASNLTVSTTMENSKELPIVLTKMKISSTHSNELVQVDPPNLQFLFLPNTSATCSVKLVNITDYHVSFNTWVKTSNMATYYTTTSIGILAPRSTKQLKVTRVANDKEVQDMECTDKFFLWRSIVAEDFKASDLTVSTTMANSTELPIVLTKMKISSTHSNELILVDPPNLQFLFLPNTSATCSVKLVNITDYHVSFNTWVKTSNMATYYTTTSLGILAPQSTKQLKVTRVANDKEVQDMECTDKFFLWRSIVAEDFKASDLTVSTTMANSTELPIVLTKMKVSSTHSNELIQVDPPNLQFLFLPNTSATCSVKLVNITDYHVSFNTWVKTSNMATYYTSISIGILAPRSTKQLKVTRMANDKEVQGMECKDKFFLWRSIVAEDFKASDLTVSTTMANSTELPIVLTKMKVSSTHSNELIQVDPPNLQFLFLPNTSATCSVKLVNITDYYVSFNTWVKTSNMATYYTTTSIGILAPRSTKQLKVTRVANDKEVQDMECKDKFFLWRSIVAEDFKASDLTVSSTMANSTELPIVLTKMKVSSTHSNGLIQVDPPNLQFLFLPNTSATCSVKLVNITDYFVSFNTWVKTSNMATYYSKTTIGILAPRSTKQLVVTRMANDKEVQDMECKDKFFLWRSIVAEDFKASDLTVSSTMANSTELPIVLTKMKISSSPSNELIQVDPPMLKFPFLPNMSVTYSVKLVNITDYYVGFILWYDTTNVATYYAIPFKGILAPRSTQQLMVTRVPKDGAVQDMECKDKYYLGRSIVAEDVEASNFNPSCNKATSMELPIILTKM